MDTAVALVQAYLQFNGYFTVAEFPVLEAFRSGAPRAVTDLDILAFRFPHASSSDVVRRKNFHAADDGLLAPDPVLACAADRPDMIVGEVKEGAARLNDAARDPAVLAVALSRFGCCPREHAGALAARVVSDGHGTTPDGHIVRLVAFGAAPEHASSAHSTIVPMHHVVAYLRDYLRQHWDVLRHAQIKDPALGVLVLLEKWGADSEPHGQARGHGLARHI